MSIILGGEKSWKVRESGQLVVAFHWVNREPAMILYPKRRPLGCVPFVIPLNRAYVYARRNGHPTPECIEKAALAAQVMALDFGKDTIHGIVTAILDNLAELVAMPPEPPHVAPKRKPIGEAILWNGGSKVAHGEITDGPDDSASSIH